MSFEYYRYESFLTAITCFCDSSPKSKRKYTVALVLGVGRQKPSNLLFGVVNTACRLIIPTMSVVYASDIFSSFQWSILVPLEFLASTSGVIFVFVLNLVKVTNGDTIPAI